MEIFIAPIIMLSIYFYIRDKYEKEPYKMVLTSIIMGAILSPIIINIEDFLMNKLYLFNFSVNVDVILISFVIAGFVEELIKLIFLYAFTIRNREVNEPFDGIVYSVYIALGFAQVENIIYYNVLSITNGSTYLFQLGINRALTAVIAHVIYGIIMGYFLGKFKFEEENKIKNASLSFILPFLIHGLYDYFVIAYQYNLRRNVIPSYFLIIINVIFANVMIDKALKRSPFKIRYQKLKARKSYEKYLKKLNKRTKEEKI